MNELVQIVQQKSGLSEEHSVDIVKAVIEYVKGKLPEALRSHVDGLVGPLDGSATTPASTETGAAGMLSSVMGGIFGGKKEA